MTGKVVIRKQISNFIGELLRTAKPKSDSFLHTLQGRILKQYIFHPSNIDKELILDVVYYKLISQKLKRQIGYFLDENCKIVNRRYEKLHIDGLKEDGSDDLNIDTFFFDVVYPNHKKGFTFGLSIYPSSHILLMSSKKVPVAVINYDLHYSGEIK